MYVIRENVRSDHRKLESYFRGRKIPLRVHDERHRPESERAEREREREVNLGRAWLYGHVSS